MEKQKNSGPWEISIQINLGESELEYRGKIKDLPKAISALESLPPRAPAAIGESGGIALPASYSTSLIAEYINARSGADLVMAAAAKITLIETKECFHRNDILREMRNAHGYFRSTYSGNLSSYLSTLLKHDRLRQAGKNSYIMSHAARRDMVDMIRIRSNRMGIGTLRITDSALPPTIEDFIRYIIRPSSPNKEYSTNCKEQVIEWAEVLGSVEDCARCGSEPVIDIDACQVSLMEHYNVPDERSSEIYNVLSSLSASMGISTDGGFCDRCNAIMQKDD